MVINEKETAKLLGVSSVVMNSYESLMKWHAVSCRGAAVPTCFVYRKGDQGYDGSDEDIAAPVH